MTEEINNRSLCSEVWFCSPHLIKCKMFEDPYCNCPCEDFDKDCVPYGEHCKYEHLRSEDND